MKRVWKNVPDTEGTAYVKNIMQEHMVHLEKLNKARLVEADKARGRTVWDKVWKIEIARHFRLE